MAVNAMGTRFEMVLCGENSVALRAAGEEAFEEIRRLETTLSLYRPSSQISRINEKGHQESVRVDHETFQLLKRAVALSAETGGLFDITVGPLVKCWGFTKGGGQMPSEAAIAQAKESVGSNHLIFDEDRSTIRFANPGMMIDLGAYGKGYALDVAANILREAGVENALLHAGASSVVGFGRDENGQPWKISVEYPPSALPNQETMRLPVTLDGLGLSVSGIWGKAFESEGTVLGHVINPLTGFPVQGAVMSSAVTSSAAEADAFTTALLVGGEARFDQLCGLRPRMKALIVIHPQPQPFRVLFRNFDIPAGFVS